jgi:hypothetical protein
MKGIRPLIEPSQTWLTHLTVLSQITSSVQPDKGTPTALVLEHHLGMNGMNL